jgi:general secretion pathway protein K
VTASRARATAPREQRGVAVVVAILVVALAASTATHLLWSSSLWLRQVENLVARAQADAVARAAAQWAAAILAEDDRTVDHFGEPWSRRIPSIPAEGVALAGTIADEQAKLNVNNLVRGGGGSPADVVVFQRLLAALGLAPALADAVVDWLDPDDEATPPGGAEDLHYLALPNPRRAANRPIVDLGELAEIRGIDAAVLARLAPYVTALPEATPINVNTAAAPVLQALVPTLTPEDAKRLIETRERTPFRSDDEFVHALATPPRAPVDALIDVRSRYFSAAATVRVGRVAAGYRALLDRGERGRPVVLALTQQVP